MTDDAKGIEAAADALWRKHYTYGPGSIGEATAKPFSKVSGQSRREYIAEAQAAIRAYLAAMEAEGYRFVNTLAISVTSGPPIYTGNKPDASRPRGA